MVRGYEEGSAWTGGRSLAGKVLFPVLAPVDGLIFTIREYPLVQEGTLIARILKDA